MKQLGNLAMVCAQRPETLMTIHNGRVAVYVNTATEEAALSTAWDNDAEINSIIRELNFGKYAVERSA